MTETSLANAPEARTETGEIKDQALTPETKPETTAPETKPAPEAKVEAKPEAKDDKSLLNKDGKKEEPKGAPEKYADFVVPEGYVLDKEVAGKASAIFKDLGLNQTQAQSLVDFYAAQTKEAAEAPYKAWVDMNKQWQDSLKADPEIGSKLDEVKTTVSRALDSLGDQKLAQDFREVMDLTGAGNHPAFAKVFYKLAQAVTEGKHVSGKSPSAFGQKAPGDKPASAAGAMWPTLP
jgi:hypothetical protein